MKEFPVSETAMIRLKAMVSPILYAVNVVLKQLEDSIDPFPVVEFMFADLFTANTAFSYTWSGTGFYQNFHAPCEVLIWHGRRQ